MFIYFQVICVDAIAEKQKKINRHGKNSSEKTTNRLVFNLFFFVSVYCQFPLIVVAIASTMAITATTTMTILSRLFYSENWSTHQKFVYEIHRSMWVELLLFFFLEHHLFLSFQTTFLTPPNCTHTQTMDCHRHFQQSHTFYCCSPKYHPEKRKTIKSNQFARIEMCIFSSKRKKTRTQYPIQQFIVK